MKRTLNAANNPPRQEAANDPFLPDALETRLAEAARFIRCHAVAAIYHAGSGHPGGALSSADLLACLYGAEMNVSPDAIHDPSRDRFVLSKGHAAPALYAAGAYYGFCDRRTSLRLRKLNSPFQGHPHVLDLPFVETSTGSLGQGISVAIGMAIGLRLQKNDARVYVLLGDGELQEGEVWEAAMAGAHHKLDNLCAMIDYNKLQSDNSNDAIMRLEPLAAKWRAFGWAVVEIDGHDISEILAALRRANVTHGVPSLIIAHTVKGKGVPNMENVPAWHGSVKLTEAQTREALAGLGATESQSRASSMASESAPLLIASSGDSLREAFGKALSSLADEFPKLVVLDADIAGGTGVHHFRKSHPDRMIQFGIAEQNMMAAAGGMAAVGLIPVVTTFAVFCLRAIEQARLSLCYARRNAKIVGSHPGLDVGPDGGSAQALEDIAAFRAIPGMTVISPADATEMALATRAMLEYDGPVYMRTGRSPAPHLFGGDHAFTIGKGHILREGTDVTLVACGVEVARAMTAAQMLAAEGLSARVVNMATIKPIDTELLARCARETGAIVTAEDHNILGGLGGAVSEVLAATEPCPVEFVGVRDSFGASGEPEELAEHFGISPRFIAGAARRAIARKQLNRAIARKKTR